MTVAAEQEGGCGQMEGLQNLGSVAKCDADSPQRWLSASAIDLSVRVAVARTSASTSCCGTLLQDCLVCLYNSLSVLHVYQPTAAACAHEEPATLRTSCQACRVNSLFCGEALVSYLFITSCAPCNTFLPHSFHLCHHPCELLHSHLVLNTFLPHVSYNRWATCEHCLLTGQ